MSQDNATRLELLQAIAKATTQLAPDEDGEDGDWVGPAQEAARVVRNQLHGTIHNDKAQGLLDIIWPQEKT